MFRGELDEAEGLLRGLEHQEELPIEDAFALFGTQALMSLARGDRKGAARLLEALESLVEDETHRRRYAQVRALVKGFGGIKGRIARALGLAARFTGGSVGPIGVRRGRTRARRPKRSPEPARAPVLAALRPHSA